MSLSLKINIVATNQVKTLRFAPDQSVHEVILHIKEKTGEGGEDHGLFQPAVEGKQSARWLQAEKTLQFYDINPESVIEFKKKHRPQKIKLLDDTIKTQLIDESSKIHEIVSQISKKMGIKNPEEYSLMRESNNEWLNSNQIISEQGIPETELLILKKKFFFNDANIDRNDPVQLHLLYVQCRDSIIDGNYPTLREESINLAALQCQIFMGDFNPAKHVSGYISLKEFLPIQWVKSKNSEKDIYREYKKLVSMSEVNAKYRYVQLCRSLKTYGMTSFDVKIRDRKKMIDHVLGVTRESLILMLTETKEVIKTYPLKHIRRWAATEKSFTLDFGDHETEYLILHTLKPEEISQLISGYIEIIMKSRKDANKTVDVDETQVGQVEQVAIKRGNVTTSSTFSGYSNNGGPGQYQVSPSQQIPITDLKNALRATDLLIGELNSMKSGVSAQPQTFSRSFTTLTPQQFKHQLVSHSNAIATAAQALFHDMSHSPASGGIAASQQNILKRAQIIMAELNTVGTSAKNAAYFPELASFSDEILGVATKISESMARLLQTASQIQGDHVDDKGRALAQMEVFSISALATMMVAVCDNDYVTDSSSNLLIECAKGVASAISQMLELGNNKLNLVDDELLYNQIENTIKSTQMASEQFLAITANLATTSAHPESKKSISTITQDTLSNVNNLLTAFKSGDIPTQDYQALQSKVSDIMDSMNLVTYALDCVEQEQKISITSNGMEIGEGELMNIGNLAEEFNNVANDLTSSIMLLRNNLKNPETIMESYKVIASNANKLINCAKSVASRADTQSQQRLFNSANAVFESVAVLSNNCKTFTKNPDNTALHSTIMESAGHLQFLTQNMSADAGKIANLTALRDHSKEMISYVSQLIATSRASASHLPDTAGMSLIKQSKDVSDCLAKLMIGIKRVVQDPRSESTQIELLNLSQKQSLPPMNLVTTSKRLAAKISDPNLKQALIFSSDAASQSVQRLMKTCENYKKVCGHLEIEEALEAFDSTIADLDTTEIAIQGGFLDIIPGQTREGSAELLMVSIKDLNNANNELTSEIRVNPNRLGELVKNSTSSASQVALASKSLISVTPGKAPQKKLMGITKQLMNDMEQLVRASRSVSTNPNDPGADLLLDAAFQDVSTTVATLVGAASHIDCKELEEASSDIQQLVAVKLHPEFISHPDEELAYYVEELGSSSKALNAAVLQIVSMARNKNIKGLGASSKITASTMATLIGHCVNAIALTEGDVSKQNIQFATSALGNQITSLLDFAKARVANYKDPIYDQNLMQASKSVEDSIAKVIRSLGSAGSNQLCDEAIDKIIESTRILEQTFLPDASGTPTTTLEMNNQQQLLTLTESSKKLGTITSNLVAQKNSSEHLGNNSMGAANLISDMIEAVKQVFISSISTSPPDMMIPCRTILDATAQITSNQNNMQTIIISARSIAAQTSQLLSVGKERVASLNEDDEQLAPIRESIIKSTQQLAMSTSSLAKAVKALSTKEPGYQQLLSLAVKDIESATGHLLISTSIPSLERGINNADFNKLLSSARSIATATSHLITSSSNSSAKPKDMELQSTLSEAAVSMTNGIKDILKVSSSMMPGVNFCEEAIEVTQRSISDLSSMALSVAVGSFDSKQHLRGEEVTHLEAQEQMVEITKSIGAGINELLKASRQSPEAIGISAKTLSYVSPQLVQATKISLATTQDPDEQNNIVTESKNLGDSILKLAQASLLASSNPSKETYQNIVTKCNNASEAMNKLVSQISSGVNLFKDLDESIERIKGAVINTNLKTNEDSTKSYQEYKDEINNNTKDLAIALKTLVATDQSNLVQISTISKDVANYVSSIVISVTAILSTTSDPKIRDSITVNAKNVISATGDIVSFLKLACTDKNLQSVGKLNDNYKVASEGITRFIQSIKQGAIGEILSDAAVVSIRKVISDIDAYSLFAAAGQLDEQSNVPSGEHSKQNLLKALQKDIVLSSKVLIVSGSQLVGSSRGTQENLGAATTKLASTVSSLVKNAKDIAAVLSDIVSQQDILSASKALSISCQQLVLAGKDAQRFKKDTTAFRSLGKGAEAVAEAVGQFLTSVYNAIADAGRGLKELEKSFVLITGYHEKPENVISNQKADPEAFAQSSRDVAKSAIEVVTSYSTSQDDLVKSSQAIVQNIQSFISNSKGIITRLGNDEATKTKVNESVKGVTLTVLNLIKQVKDQEKQGSNISVQQISNSSRDVAEKIQSILSLSKTLPGGEKIIVEDEIGEDLEQTAEDELLSCVKSIEAATLKLIASRPNAKPLKNGMLDAEGIAATIVDASSAIAKAVSKLVNAAAVAQSKRRESNQGSFYNKDPTWSNGLISSAKNVAAATHRLVEAGIKSAKGKIEEEELIATAKQVAAATAQLVSASRAKSGDDQGSQQAHHQLSIAAKAVAGATSELVAAAKAATAFDEQQIEEDNQDFNFTGSKVKELEQQVKILKLEKELEMARKQMLNTRKQNYQHQPSASPKK